MYPAKLAGAPGALIFFWFLFFHQGKKRKSRFKGNAPCVVLVEEIHAGALQILLVLMCNLIFFIAQP